MGRPVKCSVAQGALPCPAVMAQVLQPPTGTPGIVDLLLEGRLSLLCEGENSIAAHASTRCEAILDRSLTNPHRTTLRGVSRRRLYDPTNEAPSVQSDA